MDNEQVKTIASLMVAIERYYVDELPITPEEEIYRHFHLLDDTLSPAFDIVWQNTDTIEVTYDPYDGAIPPVYLNVDGMVGFILLTRLLDKSLEEKPDPDDQIPF